MIPSLVVNEVRDALVEFLSSTFALTDDDARKELDRFLRDPEDGIFRGPYLHLRTPFETVGPNWRSPVDWRPSWMAEPYAHQAKAFERLTTANGHTPQPTLVTTGTGSGKTECFLVPVLDHCARMRAAGQDGIKALILYPMNALASDQAGRIAEYIATESALDGIRAGMYVGENGHNTTMTKDGVIDVRETLRTNPPDILLTNYKMLDFLLLRPEDHDLWAVNSATTLRYIVLDEFHTYDGAQGTDVAMLLRRLGSTLKMSRPGAPLGDATPIATSATLGSSPGALEELREFAGKVFGAEFDRDSVIGETRQRPEDVCQTSFAYPIPSIADIEQTHPDDHAKLFCSPDHRPGQADEPGWTFDGGPVELGDALLQHSLTRAVLLAAAQAPRPLDEIAHELAFLNQDWGRAYETSPERVENAVIHFLRLLSIARRRSGDRTTPLFSLEIQLWIREVSRLGRAVTHDPRFRWRDSAARTEPPTVGPRPQHTDTNAVSDPSSESGNPFQRELPAVYCRRCGASGWMTLFSESSGIVSLDARTIATAAVNRSPLVRVMMMANPNDRAARWFDPQRLTFGDQAPAGTEHHDHVAVHVSEEEDDARRQTCPTCGNDNAVLFLGRAVASLASVAINTLFGSANVNHEERKLLAFTDSVQDASHRASFFGGRTHRIDLRIQLAKLIVEHGSVSLADLGDLLLDDNNHPHGRFGLIPPDLVHDRYVATTWTDDPDPYGLEILRDRVGFEVDLEFGLRSRVGRTLELSQAAVAAVEFDTGGANGDLDAVAALVAEDIERLTGERPNILEVVTYLQGLVERLRLRGGITHRLLNPYIDTGGEQWHIWGGRPDGLPPFTAEQSRPTFYTNAPPSRRREIDSLVALSKTPTWLIDWAGRSLALSPEHARDVNQRAMQLLANETDTIVGHVTKSGIVYGLDRRRIIVHDLPDAEAVLASMVRCALCGQLHAIPPDRRDDWIDTPCLRYRCDGRFESSPDRHQTYYRDLYRGGVTRRVVTGEHTGLLGRTERENLERAFKTGTGPDAPNVLTATPTLEMGIDIGDLSAVMLTSVPRNPASYLQRVGRAGRLTGNSLITAFARSDTHDLYYLSQPEAMLAGVVRPPNCHLDAVETMQRQFVAYLLDRAADRTLSAPTLPTRANQVFVEGLPAESLLAKIAGASETDPTLVEAFLDGFGSQIAERTADRLRAFAATGIRPMLETATRRYHDDLKALGSRRRQLHRAIETLEASEASGALTDDDISDLRDLRGQRHQIARLMDSARREYSLSALERFGVLPNYNLVDDAVRLVASTWSKRDDDSDDFDTHITEVDRSARWALTELAPGNRFYTAGHRHLIDAIKIGPADAPLTEDWLICPDCSYVHRPDERVAGGTDEAPTVCGRCQSPGFADTGSRYKIHRLQEVYAASSEEAARVYDDSDDRQREQYETAVLVDVEPDSVTGAWRLVDQVFGAELAQRTHIRSLNFGLRTQPGERRMVGGEEIKVSAFSVCPHCGAVEEAKAKDHRARNDVRRMHQGWCRVRRGAVARQDPMKLVLSHELTTEAIRLLLPISLFEVGERLASFTALLKLGLREDFGGDPDHLDIVWSSAPNREGQGRRRFLVLFDRVPGGTGYLARLADPERVKEILQKARRVITECPCIDDGLPACHRCLLGVADRRDYELVTRPIALDLLDQLLSDWESDKVDTIANLEIGQVEESELERRFRVALRAYADAFPDHLSVSEQEAGDRYELSVIRSDDSAGGAGPVEVARYRIEEQAGIGQNKQVLPDFVIRRLDEPGPSIAVFCDGFAYHASSDNNDISSDAAKRQSIRIDGDLVWNLSWDDVTEFHDAVMARPIRPIPDRALLVGPAANAMKAHRQRSNADGLLPELLDRNPMLLLIEYLRRPDPLAWRKLAESAVAGAVQASPVGVLDASQLQPVFEAALRADPVASTQPVAPPVAAVGRHVTANGLPIVAVLDGRDGRSNENRWTVVATLDDRAATVADDPAHRHRWRDWLQWANVLQLLTGPGQDVVIAGCSAAAEFELEDLTLVAVTSDDQASESDSAVDEPAVGTASADRPAASGTPEPASETVLDPDVAEELDFLTDEAVAAMVRAVLMKGAAPFTAGYEFQSIPLEAAWAQAKVAVIGDGDQRPATADGWLIKRVSDWTAEELIQELEARG